MRYPAAVTQTTFRKTARFLLSDAASYVTGTDLLVDGGTIAALKNRKFQLGR